MFVREERGRENRAAAESGKCDCSSKQRCRVPVGSARSHAKFFCRSRCLPQRLNRRLESAAAVADCSSIFRLRTQQLSQLLVVNHPDGCLLVGFSAAPSSGRFCNAPNPLTAMRREPDDKRRKVYSIDNGSTPYVASSSNSRLMCARNGSDTIDNRYVFSIIARHHVINS